MFIFLLCYLSAKHPIDSVNTKTQSYKPGVLSHIALTITLRWCVGLICHIKQNIHNKGLIHRTFKMCSHILSSLCKMTHVSVSNSGACFLKFISASTFPRSTHVRDKPRTSQKYINNGSLSPSLSVCVCVCVWFVPYGYGIIYSTAIYVFRCFPKRHVTVDMGLYDYYNFPYCNYDYYYYYL